MPTAQIFVISLVAIAMFAGCKDKPAAKPAAGPTAEAAAPAPDPVDAAVSALMKALGKRLKGAMADGGPVAALDACHVDAASITGSNQTDVVKIGRTSHKLRNPKNAPPAWAKAAVAAAAGKKVAEVDKAQQFELGDGKTGHLRAIGTQPLCLSCHGNDEQVSQPVRDKLAALYPEDQARGFAAGDLRGWFWVEVADPAVRARAR